MLQLNEKNVGYCLGLVDLNWLRCEPICRAVR